MYKIIFWVQNYCLALQLQIHLEDDAKDDGTRGNQRDLYGRDEFAGIASEPSDF